jgi:hypothetical protein
MKPDAMGQGPDLQLRPKGHQNANPVYTSATALSMRYDIFQVRRSVYHNFMDIMEA